jgi:DNA-binding protein HU-beta
MNKAEFMGIIAEKSGVTKKDTEKVWNTAVTVITDSLQKGEKVHLVGFGTFEVKSRAARMGRNPRTREEVEIPASKVPVFKVSKVLKDSVAK